MMGYLLHSSSNVSDNERKMVLTACTTTTFDAIKSALKRIVGSSGSASFTSQTSSASASLETVEIKEECYYNEVTTLQEEEVVMKHDVMMSLRTMLSFQVLRAAVLCVGGSRRPWSQNTSKLSSDFGLSLFEAGLKG